MFFLFFFKLLREKFQFYGLNGGWKMEEIITHLFQYSYARVKGCINY